MSAPNLNSITTVTPGLLASSQMASGAHTLYTVAADKAVKVSKLILANVTAVPVTVTVSVVPAGGTVDGTHTIVPSFVLNGNDSTAITEIEGLWMSDGDSISINPNASASIDATLSGLVMV